MLQKGPVYGGSTPCIFLMKSACCKDAVAICQHKIMVAANINGLVFAKSAAVLFAEPGEQNGQDTENAQVLAETVRSTVIFNDNFMLFSEM